MMSCHPQVGAMSHIRLSDITNSFVKKLEERVLVRKDSTPRAVDVSLLRSQALKLCAGVRVGCVDCRLTAVHIVWCVASSSSAAHPVSFSNPLAERVVAAYACHQLCSLAG